MEKEQPFENLFGQVIVKKRLNFYLEAFANVYKNFANHIRAIEAGKTPDDICLDYPKIEDGVRGMAFIDAVVSSSKNNAAWTVIET